MDPQTLFELVARSGDPISALNANRAHITRAFVGGLNATTLDSERRGDLGPALMGNGWALHAARLLGDPLLEARTLAHRGRFAAAAGRIDDAVEAYHAASLLYGSHGTPEDRQSCEVELARLAPPVPELEPDAAPEPPARVVRVFVSSTFRDMGAEREELVKRVFPELRRLCDDRGVVWADVDLRWGIPDEAAAEGGVLPICLEEIRRCRPFFIGLLGDRYGWVPEAIPADLAAREPWLAAFAGRSVTELEIVHGVLNDPAMADHAFFYFRHSHAGEPDPRVADLKRRIRDSGLPVREGYRDPPELASMVAADFTAVIDRLFPSGETPDPIAADRRAHGRFAARHTDAHVEREWLFERLDAHVAGSGPPLVVVGGPGSGKTALLANWADRRRTRNGATPVISHFVGATADSADWTATARRVLGEFFLDDAIPAAAGFEPEPSIDLRRVLPAEPDALRLLATEVLRDLTSPAILVLDGLDRLEAPEGGSALGWLPPEPSPRLRAVVSVAPGPALDFLARRGWPILELPQLAEPERRRMVVETLARHAKALSPERVERIVAAAPGDPLHLRIVLEELRLHGEHESLDARIDELTRPADVVGLFGGVLERFERDYDRDRPGLTRDALTALWAARRGLGEAELLDVLGAAGAPLPRRIASPLLLALEHWLLDRGGVLSLAHDDLRRAVERRWLARPEERRASFLQLADYFRRRGMDRRSAEEAPWLLLRAEAWEELGALLADPAFIRAALPMPPPRLAGPMAIALEPMRPPELAAPVTPLELRELWAAVEAHSSIRMTEACAAIVQDPGPDPGVAARVAALLESAGHLAESRRIHQAVAAAETGDDAWQAHALASEGTVLCRSGRFEEGLDRLRRAEAIYRRGPDADGLIACLGNQGAALQGLGRRAEALAIHMEVEGLYRRRGNRSGTARALAHQAAIHATDGEDERALDLYRQVDALAGEAGDLDLLALSLENQSAILARRPGGRDAPRPGGDVTPL